VRKADNLPPSGADCQKNLVALTSWNPMGLFRSVMGQLYLTYKQSTANLYLIDLLTVSPETSTVYMARCADWAVEQETYELK